MRQFPKGMESSGYSNKIEQKKELQKVNQMQGYSSQTDRTVQMRSKSKKSQALTEHKKMPTFTHLATPNSQYSETYFQRQTYSVAGEYFEQQGQNSNQHQYSIDRANLYPQSLTNSKQSLEKNSKGSDSLESEVRKMKNIIIEKDRCLRDITERLKMIMEQLQRYQIESKANQCFTRLMSDLSRMFQIPQISIQDIRIQVSMLLEERKSREHYVALNERKNVEQIQQLIDKLNNEANMKNMLEIKMVDISNENMALRSTIETLTASINQQNIQLKEIYQEGLAIKQQLEQSNRMRRSGTETMSNQNRFLKIQSDKVQKQRDQLEAQLRQLQMRLLDNQGVIVDQQSKYNSQIRRRDFHQQQLKKELQISNNLKQKLFKQNQDLSRLYNEIEVNRIQLHQMNLNLSREVEKNMEEKRIFEEQFRILSLSKEDVKHQLIGQQQKRRQQYESYINSYKQNLYQLQCKLKEAVQNQKSRSYEIGQCRILNQRLQIELHQKQKELQEHRNYQSNMNQAKINIEEKLNITLREMESLRQSKQLEIDQKHRQMSEIRLSFQQVQRELKIRQNEVESMKRSYNSQSQSLDKVNKNLMTQYTKEHQLRVEFEEELRFKHNQIVDYQNQIQILERQNSSNIGSSQRLDSLIKGEIDARKEAERMKDLSEKSIQKQRIQFEEKISEEHLNTISLSRQVEDLHMTISKLKYKIEESEQMIRFLKSQLESRDKANKQLKDSYNTGARQYEKLSLELSTSHKDLLLLKDSEHQKKIQQINSFVLELQNTLRSKETIIQKLNFQLESIGSNFPKNINGSQSSLNLSNQQMVGGKQDQDQLVFQQIARLKEENRLLEENYILHQQAAKQKQQSYKQLMIKYQNEISQLRQQIAVYQQNNNLRGSHSSVNSMNKHMSVINSQQFHTDELLKAQQLKYETLENQSNKQMNELKYLHSEAIRALQQKYNQSKQQLTMQLNNLVLQTENIKMNYLNQQIKTQNQIKLLYEAIQQKDRIIKANFGLQKTSQGMNEQVILLMDRLQNQTNLRTNLELEVKAYEQAITQIRKQHIEQQKQFQTLKEKNIQTSFTKVNQMEGLFQRQKESLLITIQNQMLQIKTLESENSQLKMEVVSLKQPQVHPRPPSIQYTKQLEQKTMSVRQLQMQNSTLTIAIDDLRKQMHQKQQKMYQFSRKCKDEKFDLEKQNIQLISKIKILEIKIDQLTFQLNSLRELKANTLLSGKVIGSLNLQNRTLIASNGSISQTNHYLNLNNTNSINNSFQNQTTIDLLQEKNVKIPHASAFSHNSNIVSKQSIAIPKGSVISNLGVSKHTQLESSLMDRIQTKQQISHSQGLNSINSQFTFNLNGSGLNSHKNPSPGKGFTNGSINLISSSNNNNSSLSTIKTPSINTFKAINYQQADSIKQSKRRISPHQQRITPEVKEDVRPYFQKRIEIPVQNSNLKPYYSTDRNQYSPKSSIQTARSLQKQIKVFDYSRVYDQNIKIKQSPPISQLYDNNKYFSSNQAGPTVSKQSKSIIDTPIAYQPYSFNSIGSSSGTKINLKQFAPGEKVSEYFASVRNMIEKAEDNAESANKVVNIPNYQRGISMYQLQQNGKGDSCC